MCLSLSNSNVCRLYCNTGIQRKPLQGLPTGLGTFCSALLTRRVLLVALKCGCFELCLISGRFPRDSSVSATSKVRRPGAWPRGVAHISQHRSLMITLIYNGGHKGVTHISDTATVLALKCITKLMWVVSTAITPPPKTCLV